MGALNRKYQVIAFKKESVEGTAEALTAAEGKLLVYDFNYNPQPQMNERRPMRNTLTPLTSRRGLGEIEFSFRFELKGEDGTADSVPSWGPIQEAAQFKQTVNVGVDVTWTPNDSPPGASLTMGAYIDGTSVKMRGARVTAWKLNWNPGTFPTCEVTVRGIMVGTALTDTAILTPTFPTALPEMIHTGTMTLDGLALTASEVSIEAEIQSTQKFEAGKEHGLLSIWTSRSRFTMTVNPQLELHATKDWLEKLMTDATMAFVANVGTGITGHHINLDAPKFQVESYGDGEREALALAELSGFLAGAEGGVADEFTITKD